MILTVPATIPVTTPEEETVATDGMLLLQVPPVVALLNVVVKPAQVVGVPELADNAALTATVVVL